MHSIKSKSKSKEDINIELYQNDPVLLSLNGNDNSSKIRLIDDKEQTRDDREQIEKEINNI